MRKYTFLALFFLLSLSAVAQKYRTAVGVRIGRDNFGASIQQKVMERSTVEGIFSAGSNEVLGTVLLEKHFPILGKGFNYYLGGGGHVGKLKDFGTLYGADAIIGTELKLPLFPLLLSLDLKPSFHANHPDEWFDVGGGFTLRYLLVKEKKEKRGLRGIFGGGQDEDKGKKKKKGNQKEEPRKGGLFGF